MWICVRDAAQVEESSFAGEERFIVGRRIDTHTLKQKRPRGVRKFLESVPVQPKFNKTKSATHSKMRIPDAEMRKQERRQNQQPSPHY